jgi:hypothetical protein
MTGILDVPPLQNYHEKTVMAVKEADILIDVYIIKGKGFYHYNPWII